MADVKNRRLPDFVIVEDNVDEATKIARDGVPADVANRRQQNLDAQQQGQDLMQQLKDEGLANKDDGLDDDDEEKKKTSLGHKVAAGAAVVGMVAVGATAYASSKAHRSVTNAGNAIAHDVAGFIMGSSRPMPNLSGIRFPGEEKGGMQR